MRLLFVTNIYKIDLSPQAHCRNAALQHHWMEANEPIDAFLEFSWHKSIQIPKSCLNIQRWSFSPALAMSLCVVPGIHLHVNMGPFASSDYSAHINISSSIPVPYTGLGSVCSTNTFILWYHLNYYRLSSSNPGILIINHRLCFTCILQDHFTGNLVVRWLFVARDVILWMCLHETIRNWL